MPLGESQRPSFAEHLLEADWLTMSSGSSGRILSLDDCFVDRVLRYMLTTERGARVMVNATLIGWVMVGTSGDNTRQVDEYPDSVS